MFKRSRANPTAAEIASALDLARGELAKAEAVIAKADADYQAGLLSEEPAALRRLLDAKAEASVAADIARAKVAKLESQHADALDAEAEAGRQASYDQAKTMAEAARKRLAEYERAAMQIRDVLRAIAEADIAVATANDDLPAGAERLAKPEEVRSVPNLYRAIVHEEPVAQWASADNPSTPIPTHLQNRVQVDRVGKRIKHRYDDDDFDEGGRELATVRADHGGMIEVVRRQFIQQTVLPDQGGHFASPLATKIELPALYDGQRPYWEASNSNPQWIIAELEKPIGSPRIRPDRVAVIEYVPAPRGAA